MARKKTVTNRKELTQEQLTELLNALAHASPEDIREAMGKLTREQLLVLRYILNVLLVRGEDSPRSFASYFLLMQGFPLHSEGREWIEKAYIAHAEGRGQLQECHRESGKTTVFSKNFGSYRVGKEPHKTSGIIRINDQKANETANDIANIIMNDPMWKVCFPHVVPDVPRGWGENKGFYVKRIDISQAEWTRLKTQSPSGATFIGYGWKNGSIIGSRFNGFVIIDDIHDRENTRSATQMEEIKGFYKDTLLFCVMKGVWELWNFTPWLTNDVYAYVKSLGLYSHSKTPVMLPAKEGEEGATFWPKHEQIPISGSWWKLYWPERWGFEEITEKYIKAGPIDFAREMLLNLDALKGFNLKAEWLHEYPSNEIKTSWPVIFGIDYASTSDKLKQKERDYFALAILRAIPGGGLVITGGHFAHLSKGEALEATMSLWGMYPTLQKIGVETVGKGEEFYNDLVFMDDVNGRVPPLYEVKHGRKSKGERFVEWLAPRCQMSRIWLSDAWETDPFLRRFRDEWLMWDKYPHDDCLDAVYMAAATAESFMPSRAERSFKKEKAQNPFSVLGNYSYLGR